MQRPEKEATFRSYEWLGVVNYILVSISTPQNSEMAVGLTWPRTFEQKLHPYRFQTEMHALLPYLSNSGNRLR